MRTSPFVTAAILIFVCSSARPAVGKDGLYRSEGRAEVLKNWIHSLFIEEPLVTALPLNLPDTTAVQWFTESELRSNQFLLNNPTEMARVEKVIASTHVDRDRRVSEARLQLFHPDHAENVSFEEKRPLIYINAPRHLNPYDLEGQLGALEAPLKVDSNVIRLVDNKLFAAKLGISASPSIPPSMEDFINSEFSRLKSELPPSASKLISKCQMTFSPPPDQKLLWLGSDVREHYTKKECPFSITISPLLVRAIFVRAAGSNAYNALNALNGPSGERLDVADLLLTSFAKEIHFVLAHEIGHLFFDRMSGLDLADEECVDQEALVLTKQLDNRVELGAFSSILDKAIAQHQEQLWSLERSSKAQDVQTRVSLARVNTTASMSSACRGHYDFAHLNL